MSTLLMVRHGQASFGSSDYDKLSELGITQSFTLGEHWARHCRQIDAAVTGAQQRQKHTFEAVSEVYRVAGKEFPEPILDAAFNEYDATAIMTRFLPRLLQEDKRLQELVSGHASQGANSTEGRKAFQEAFAIVMNSWIKGDADVDGVESWAAFKKRVVTGIEKIMTDYPEGKTVAVFTSGGAISAALQYALGISDRMALELGWVVKNASINEFKYKGDMFTMTGFNMTPHFNDEALITYR